MRIESVQNDISMQSARRYQDLSQKILKSERKDLIDLAEFFHTAKEKELRQVTESDNKAYEMLKSAIDMVITRKKCYLADGSSFCAQRANDLDIKAANRSIYLMG